MRAEGGKKVSGRRGCGREEKRGGRASEGERKQNMGWTEDETSVEKELNAY